MEALIPKKMTEIAKEEGVHYQTVVKQKDKYLPVKIKIGKKDKYITRYLCREESNRIKSAVADILSIVDRTDKIKIALEIYNQWEKQKQYKLTTKDFKEWIDDYIKKEQNKRYEEQNRAIAQKAAEENEELKQKNEELAQKLAELQGKADI